ncbi:hypothetical protein [Vibrio mangrovi]|uniref:Uncharacterized protein n=1 Tax=Vibrio mangrovi TaxID=474394 RepID=A0A1Y6IQR0_9VIBR|nr:hypothetical protein [Vibrio mangrovi]MDW6003223.1 hypothetical protein [Vibrio mangrovi]SMR99989.1 hypothetical protein VIM7927_01227 [Vibrio mangrovi]
MKLLHLQLFWYEKHHTLLEMEDLPELSPTQGQALQNWLKKRRKILSYEVHHQPWVKVNIDGFSSTLFLQPNGTLTEQDLFSDKALQGLWKVVDGFLFIKVISGEFIIEYQIVGCADNNIHCGIEYINGQVSSYSKFIQTRS